MTAPQFRKEIMLAYDVDRDPSELRDEYSCEDGDLFAVYKLDRILKLVDASHLQLVTPNPKK